MTADQEVTIARLTSAHGAPDYVNSHKPETAIWADWWDAEISARITPDGQWENMHDALVNPPYNTLEVTP